MMALITSNWLQADCVARPLRSKAFRRWTASSDQLDKFLLASMVTAYSCNPYGESLLQL